MCTKGLSGFQFIDSSDGMCIKPPTTTEDTSKLLQLLIEPENAKQTTLNVIDQI